MSTQRTLIRNGYVLTMDPAVGDLPDADVLINDGKIVDVGRNLDASEAEVIDASHQIVMPGLVDTHRHTWQIQARAICADWTLGDYFAGIRLSISPAYQADDVYLGNYVGALDALNSGVTTILDFSHCNNTPEHADGAVRGLEDAGIRAVFCYGFFASSPDNPAFPDHASRLADFRRIAASFPRAAGRLTLGVALNEVGLRPWQDTAAEIEVARQHSAVIAAHTGCQWGSQVTMGIKEMEANNLLGPDHVHIHCNTLDDEEWKALARAGAKVSISPETELNMGMGRPVFQECLRYGIKPTVSCDVISLNSGDLFHQMRLGIASQRFFDNDVVNKQGLMPTSLTVEARDALMWGTLNGAEACGLADQVGSLTPGKAADVVILGGRDSLTLRPRFNVAGSVVFQATAADVQTVLVGGETVKRDGHLVGVDLGELLDKLEASAAGVMGRATAAVGPLPPTLEGASDEALNAQAVEFLQAAVPS